VLVPLPVLLESHLAGSDAVVERAIFGTAEPERIGTVVAETARHLTDSGVEGGLFYIASSGCVFGLRLHDGRSVVLKAYQSHWQLPFLRAVQRVQGALATSGFPCPAPLAGPVPVGPGWAMLESYLADPGLADPGVADPGPGPRLRDDRFMEQSIAGLVRLIESARGVDSSGLELDPFLTEEGALYPTPHSPIFDFPGTAEGAEWIDGWARRARAIRSSGEAAPVIAHLDWSARNVRLAPSGVTAVYDWDAVGLAPEAVVAGQAAATWRSTGETGDTRAPGADEIERFITSFGRASGMPFSPRESKVARAASVWVMAYTARCEHALARTRWRRERAREWLRTEAAVLLP
jgi:Ser/Thr protein kinase RdoA (MazF antagonist)